MTEEIIAIIDQVEDIRERIDLHDLDTWDALTEALIALDKARNNAADSEGVSRVTGR